MSSDRPRSSQRHLPTATNEVKQASGKEENRWRRNLDALTFVGIRICIVSYACLWYTGASKGTNGEGYC